MVHGGETMGDAGESAVAPTPIAVGGRRDSPFGSVPGSYLRALAAAGARPVVLEPDAERVDAAAELLGPCAGLLLAGGGDVDPALYGGRAGGGDDAVDPLRDACELTLLDAATARGLPVLAICHGMQLLNVAHGGTLAQRIPLGGAVDHGTPVAYARHSVRLRPGSRLAQALGEDAFGACSSHHRQALDRLGDGLVATGWSDDGLVEAIEDPGPGWVVGVQWHPEDTAAHDAEQRRVFAAFVSAAARAAAPAVSGSA